MACQWVVRCGKCGEDDTIHRQTPKGPVAEQLKLMGYRRLPGFGWTCYDCRKGLKDG